MRALLLATAAWLGAAGAAAAQPLSGVYIGGGAMLNFLQDSDVTLGAGLAGSAATLGMGNSGTVKYNLGYGGALAVGYGFGNGLRAELEGSYRYNEVDSISGFGGGGSFGQIRGSQRTYGMMANVLYEFDVSPRFRPYLGAGVGWMWTEWHAVRGTNSIARIGSDDTDSSFAYQLIAGFAVPISQRWALTLDYRFLQVVDPELDGLAARVARAERRFPRQHEHRQLQPLHPARRTLRLQRGPAARRGAAGRRAGAGAHLPGVLRLEPG
jgi:OOP family OmpA-OmpF porin